LHSPDRRELARVDALRAGLRSRLLLWTDADARTIAPIYAELCRRSSHDPALVLAGPGPGGDADRDARRRLASAREHVHAPDWGSSESRASALASCDLGLMFGAAGGGATACAEAMASALAIVAVAGRMGTGRDAGARAAELVRESGCGRTVHDASPARIAEAVRALASDPARAELGGRGRPWITRFTGASCFAREQICVAEILEHVRLGRRAPAGIHERMQPLALGDAGVGDAGVDDA